MVQCEELARLEDRVGVELEVMWFVFYLVLYCMLNEISFGSHPFFPSLFLPHHSVTPRYKTFLMVTILQLKVAKGDLLKKKSQS